MGTMLSTSTPTVQNTQKADDTLRGFDLHRSTAAVVGAGIAGVHVAYELAQIGFDVTVFERNGEIASGETRYALPFVGVGLLEPWLSTAHVSRNMLLSLIFPSMCPDIITRDHAFNSIFSAALHRWLYCRTRSAFTEREVMWYTDNLSRLSVSVIEDIVKRHPEMADHVVATQINLSQVDLGASKGPNDQVFKKATTAHAMPIAIDPVKWTQGLADIARRKYGVRFALGERVEGSHTYLKYDVESTKSLLVSKADPANPGARVKSDARFDVVVYAAGAQTGPLTWQSSQVPVIGLTGWAVMLKNPTGQVQTALRSLFSSAPGAAVAVSPRCGLFGLSGSSQSSGHHNDDATTESTRDTWYRLSGLLSLDTTSRDTVNVRRVLTRMESYLRVNAHAEVPLTTLLDDATTARSVDVQEYVRAFTPDGVPIVDHSGGAFNTYVCCGFGDQAPDFAPGASKILGKLVEQQAQTLLEEDRKYMEEHGMPTTLMPVSRRATVETELEMLMNGVLPSASSEKVSGTSYGARLLKSLRGGGSGAGAATGSGTHGAGGASTTPRAESADSRKNGAAASEVSVERANERPPADAVRHISFEKNPFSTDRYRKVIAKDVKDVTHRSPVGRLYDAEQSLSEALEPMFRRFRRHVVKAAREDNVPNFVRTAVVYFFYDVEDDPEELASQTEMARRMQALSWQRESATDPSAAGSGVAPSADNSSLARSIEKQEEMARRAREVFLGNNASAAGKA